MSQTRNLKTGSARNVLIGRITLKASPHFRTMTRNQHLATELGHELGIQQPTDHPASNPQSRLSPVSSSMQELFASTTSGRSAVFSNAIAVLPLTSNANGRDLDYVCDGISQDLLEGLVRLKWLPVIAYSSTCQFRSADRDIIAIADELGARYVVEGDMAVQGNNLNVRVRLTNASNGLSMWSQEYSMDENGMHSAIRDIQKEIIGIIDNKIDLAEQMRFLSNDKTMDEYHNHIWRGRWHLNKLTLEDSEAAKYHFDAALAIRPDEAEVHIQLGYWNLYRAWVSRGTADQIREALEHAHRAMTLDSSDGRAFYLHGMAKTWLGEHEEAIGMLQHAIQLNPSLAMAYLQQGSTYYLSGRPELAIEPLETAIRLSPHDGLIFNFFGELAMAHLMADNFQLAVEHATHAIWLKPRYWYGHVIRIYAYSKLGHSQNQKRAAMELAQTGRKLAPEYFEWLPFKDKEWVRELQETTNLTLQSLD